MQTTDAGPTPDTVLGQDVLDDYAYPRIPGGRWWLRANMVCSVDGAATGPDGRSGSLSCASDRTLFHHLRGLCDAVVVGAGTVRAENYGPPAVDDETAERRVDAGLAPRPRLVVVSRTLDLDPAARLFTGPDRVVVVTSRAADWGRIELLGQVADVVRVGEEAVDLPEMLGLLSDQGLPRLLCEGGPLLLGDLVAGRLLDELCLTVVPSLVGGDASRVAVGGWATPSLPLALSALWRADDGALLTRWSRS